jgi:hypothetical protein
MSKTIKKNSHAYKALIAKLQSGKYEGKRYTLNNGFTGEVFTDEQKQYWSSKNIAQDIERAKVTKDDATQTITIHFHSNYWIYIN